MAYIEKRKSPKGMRFRAVIRLKGCPAKSATFMKLSDARHWAHEVEAKLICERSSGGDNSRVHTLNEAIEKYMRDVAPRTPKSYESKKSHLFVWNKLVGHLPLFQINAIEISKNRDKISRSSNKHGGTKSPTTVNRYLASLSHLLTVAANEWGWIEASPMVKVTKFREPRGRVRFLNSHERRSLLDACKLSRNHHLYTIVVMAISCGMRKSEMLNLRWSEVDFDRDRVTLLETKNGERRAVPLVGRAKRLVWDLWDVPKRSEYVFESPLCGRYYDLKIAWKGAIERSGLIDFRFHDLRHCTGSYLAMNGATPHDIAEVLGHKSLAMVMRYTHLCETHVTKVVERMNSEIF